MMKSVDAYQVYLMSGMRNAELVAEGLRLLGIDASEVTEAKEMVEAAGLLESLYGRCHAEDYRRFLGEPLRTERARAEDLPYHTTMMFYALPVWRARELELELRFSGAGELSGIQFVRAGGPRARGDRPGVRRARGAGEPRGRRVRFEEVVPWSVVEDDVLFSCSEARSADGFGTFMDYRCVLLDRGGEAYYWAFDFGLLQRVWRWEELSQDEVENLALGDDIIDVDP
ncbi:hypothetical protein [Sorangium sp. So ce1335]|uniref:hypothetical protein n=1 Tax=Sorangium sp. So ce1335 TaxID=3133335 RepID=UPI003F5F43CD